ncbi:hypothetical protein [Streptomyces sp. MT206]|uniref:hypothetical protein n=1 Tax=Streptomyces sp. MT206 TaxID=3031407 RepID=UPI002FCB81B7
MPAFPGLHEDRTARDLGCYGRLNIVTFTDSHSGSALYRLDAPHVRGCVMLTPAAVGDDPTKPVEGPDDLLVSPDRFAPSFAALDPRPLSINNVRLTGPVRTAPGEMAAFRPLRKGKTGRHEWLPRRTHVHALAVLDVVVRHWLKHCDIDALTTAARRQAALSFLDTYNSQLEGRRERLILARTAVADAERRVLELRDLISA